MPKQNSLLVLTCLVSFIATTIFALPPEGTYINDTSNSERSIDLGTYIDANNILMFVTNRGSIAYDQGAILGKNDGFYYPFTTINDLENGLYRNTAIFAAGLWIGGVEASTGNILISVAEYSDDFYPGKMIGGTYDPNGESDPVYRVYKIYSDSMAGNPNQDYNEWPVSQGAPVDAWGNPLIIGDQTLWSVYNDANSANHLNDASTAVGMGIEVQQSVWAADEAGDISVPLTTKLGVTQLGSSPAIVVVSIINNAELTGDDYKIVLDTAGVDGFVWHLYNITLGTVVLENQTGAAEADGFVVGFGVSASISSFEVVANGAGPIDPPAAGAFDFQGFPTGVDAAGDPLRPDANQQVGEGKWGFHTGDNGGTCHDGDRGSYERFLERSLRGGNFLNMGRFDYEMRFTADTNASGVYDSSLGGGSIGVEAYTDNGYEKPIWLPFELWRTGIGTPNDPSDDIRMVPWVLEMDDSDDTYNLENWGCDGSASFGGAGEHSASGADNDPYTDWIYWILDNDETPGDAGYQDAAAQILDWTPGNTVYDFAGTEIFARTVLINWNGDTSAASTGPPFNQSLPEPGTVFRINTAKEALVDSFVFNSTAPSPINAGPDGLSIYVKYKLFNKGNKTINDFYISMWFDPDLGDAGDDFVGCDSANEIFFCYNDGADQDYGVAVPAVGGKLIEGPTVYSPGDTAYINGVIVPDYKNLKMTSFNKYVNGADPQNPFHTYNFMQGLTRDGFPLTYNGVETKFYGWGDPVAGTGFLDVNSSDRRMMASFGPIPVFAPGDSQQVVVRLAIGQGTNQLNSILALKEVLNSEPLFEQRSPKAIIEPGYMNVIMANLIVPETASVYIGDFSRGYSAGDIVFSNLRVNGSIVPSFVEIQSSHPGFSGEVVKMKVSIIDFLNGYMPYYDSGIEPFEVSGLFSDSGDFVMDGQISIRGHASGDVNLDGIVNLLDVVFMIDYLFRGGASPPLPELADVNGSCGVIDISDVVYLGEYLYRDGNSPVVGDCQ